MTIPQKKHVIVVGGGFGGLQVTKTLSQHKNLEVTLIDKNNHHLFQPLLYQIATAVLSPADIALPLRALIRSDNVKVVLDEVKAIDKDKHLLSTKHNTYSYDYLVLAMGGQPSYFDHHHWHVFAPGLKSIHDARNIRQRLLLAFEKAEMTKDKVSKEKLLHFAIIGGGPTGVELAGAIAELSKKILSKDFKSIDSSMIKVSLIEARDRLLLDFSPRLSLIAKEKLEQRGVEVILNAFVENMDQQGIHLEKQTIKASTILWAAGVEANPFALTLKAPLDHAKRVEVNQFCALEKYPEIFVIGDMASFSEGLEHPLPGIAPVAIQQGRYVGNLIAQETQGKQRKTPFVYKGQGKMAVIGRFDAIAQMGSLEYSGFIGWFLWLFIHLIYQVGFKNKISIFFTWVWTYITFSAGARLIEEEQVSSF